MFVGRKNELQLLKDAHASDKSELVVLYGRRRIGKSSLVHQFAQDKADFYRFEALEGESTPEQIRHFTETLKKQTNDSLLESVRFIRWEQVFSYLTTHVIPQASRKTKSILFFDEVQWMAAGRSKLVSLLKYYWDNEWKAKGVMLILCGSIAAFMVQKVIRSKALYGRITLEILLTGLSPHEVYQLMQRKRSQEEILKYLLIFGGVPKYLEEINLNQSFYQNINRLCFSAHGVMIQEMNRVFYNQFKEAQNYVKIVSLLQNRMYSFGEISAKTGIPSGGGLKLYLDNLEQAEIIKSFISFHKGMNTKHRKYALTDEYLIFYFKYMAPNLRTIAESRSQKIFERLARDSFDPWLGFAFERFCVKHAGYLARLMGFGDEILIASPYFAKEDHRFQIDLLYLRMDQVMTVCEIKHRNREINTQIIPEMEKKCALLQVPRGFSLEKALISLYGPDQALKDSGYFNHFITLEDIFTKFPKSLII